MQLQFSPGCMSLISSDVQTLDLSHTSVLLSHVCVSVFIHLFLYLFFCSVQYFVWCPLLVSSLCFSYCFFFGAHLSLRSWIKYCGVLLFLLVCLPSVVCVFVLLLVCILLMHFSTFCTFTFSIFILIFLLFILIGTYF